MFRSSPVKAGRNDPCPCGSGKKYKKCCLSQSQVPDNSPASQTYAAQARLFEELANFLTRRFRDEFLTAWADYYLAEEGEDLPEPNEDHETVFMPYTLLHWDPDSPDATTNCVDGGLVARTFLHERSRRLRDMDREILEILMRQPFSFYEVVSWLPDEDFLMRDLWTGQELTVSKLSADEELAPGEIMYAQMLPMPGVTVIAFSAPIAIGAAVKPAILGYRDNLHEQLEGGPAGLILDDVRAEQDELRMLYFEILQTLDPDSPVNAD